MGVGLLPRLADWDFPQSMVTGIVHYLPHRDCWKPQDQCGRQSLEPTPLCWWFLPRSQHRPDSRRGVEEPSKGFD